MPQKPLMVLSDPNLRDLAAGPSTGLNFHVIQTNSGLVVAYQDGDAMPLYPDLNFYCLDDLLAGTPVPARRSNASITIQRSFSGRFSAINALITALISPAYTGTTGAFPLVATYTLAKKTIFRRYLNALPDRRFSGAHLTAGTYLTSILDAGHADTGFGAVGRYALPIPLPSNIVVEYELPAGTTIEVGTVSPNFGQAGGGVEVHLPGSTPATFIRPITIDDY